MQYSLKLLPDRMAVCKLGVDDLVPEWAKPGDFLAAIRTPEELTLVCAEASVPSTVQSEPGWRALCVQGSLDFSLVGVLASILNPLADAGVSVFTLSTYETDYILVKEDALERSIQALSEVGFSVVNNEYLST